MVNLRPQRVRSASLLENAAYLFIIEATNYQRVDFYDRPMFAESPATSRMASNTPNLPQIVAEPVPDVRRRLALTVQILAPRVVRLRLGERAAPDFGILLDPEPAGRCYPAT